MAVKLSEFEGLEVTQSSIEIPDAAGGLRAALKIDPVELHKGDRVYVALECEVVKVRFDPVDKEDLTGEQARIHVFRTVSAAIVEKDLVGDALAAQADRIAEARELEGQTKLPTSPPFLGYEDLTAKEVVERLDEADFDLLERVEAWENANGPRATVLKAVVSAGEVLEARS
jgi:hypothetical protein